MDEHRASNLLPPEPAPESGAASLSSGTGSGAGREHRGAGRQRVLLAGGGTGGHVYPALAIAEELVARGWEVTLCGRPGSFEERVITGEGFPFAALPAHPLVGRGAFGKARALARLAPAALRGRRLVRRLGARAVAGTGGYVSAPAVLGGRLAGVPVLLVEPNAVPGVANRWLSRWAREAAVAWPQAGRALRCPATVTGVPVRREFRRDAMPAAAGPPWRLLVLGGSQGARQLNELLPPALERVADAVGSLEVLHQCGADHVEATREAYGTSPTATMTVVPYIDDVAGEMARAHLVISRAGAVTLAELAAAGRPAVLLPLALAGGHQADNAKAHAAAGAAVTPAAEDSTPERLAATVTDLLQAPDRLAAMTRAAHDLARPEAASHIAHRIEALAADPQDPTPRTRDRVESRGSGSGAGAGLGAGRERP